MNTFWVPTMYWGFSCSSVGKESACNAGYQGSTSVLGRSSGEGNSNPLQCSWLEISWTERGAWQATVPEVTRVVHDLATKPLLYTRCVCLWRTQSLAEDINEWITRNAVFGAGNTGGKTYQCQEQKGSETLTLFASQQVSLLMSWMVAEDNQFWFRDKGLYLLLTSGQTA